MLLHRDGDTVTAIGATCTHGAGAEPGADVGRDRLSLETDADLEG